MPVQQQMSQFAKKLGGRVAAANAEHADKPVDTGNRRLPGGIRDAVAKLSAMYTKEYEDDKAGMKGQTFFRASAITVSPATHNGEKIAGIPTSVVIPLCDKPAKGLSKAVSFDENWYEFQNLFKLLGIVPPVEPGRDVAAGERIQAYYFAAMKTLTDPVRMKTSPVYISFSTRGWTPPPSQAQPKPEEMVFETWHGLATFDGRVDPGAGVSDGGAGTQPPPMTPPPSPQPSANGAGAVQPPVNYDRNDGPGPQYQPPGDPADVVAALVEAAMDDPEGATAGGAEASSQLEQMAWAAGWSRDQTAGATDWAQVGDMALNPPTAASVAPTTTASPLNIAILSVGSRWWFAKRSKDGERLKNNKGVEFPPQEVEVVTADNATKICTLKTMKDGKDVVDIRTKKPAEVKYDWLEAPPY